MKRAIVVALAYSLVIEYAVSYIPATVNQLTISYRLRGLLSHWLPLHLEGKDRLELLFGTETVTEQLVFLAIIVLVPYSLQLRSSCGSGKFRWRPKPRAGQPLSVE